MKKVKVEIELRDDEHENLSKHLGDIDLYTQRAIQGVLKQKSRELQLKTEQRRARLLKAAPLEVQEEIDRLLGM